MGLLNICVVIFNSEKVIDNLEKEKILISLPNDQMGGAEQYLFEMCVLLSEQYKVDVVFLKRPITNFWNDKITDSSVNLIYLDASTEKIGFIRLFFWMLKNNSKYRFGLTSHVHLNAIFEIFRSFGALNIDKHIARESTFIFNRFKGVKLLQFKIMYLLGYQNIDLLISQSKEMEISLRNNLKKSWMPRMIETIPNLVNFNQIKKLAKEFSPPKENYIISAGRLIPEKGFDILIKAFSEIQQKTNLQLLILGEGKERGNLDNLIKSLEIENRVKLIGFKSNPMPYFQGADLCVVSSRVEGFPNVLLQMMALNGNVISTNCAGGITDLRGVSVCPTNNIKALSELMIKHISDRVDNSNLFIKELERRSPSSFFATALELLYE